MGEEMSAYNANAKNNFAIVIPSHRVINHNGGLGGYGDARLDRKKWLIDHEQFPTNTLETKQRISLES